MRTVDKRSLNVLIADDDPSIRTLLDATIGRSGEHAVTQATNGEEALRMSRDISDLSSHVRALAKRADTLSGHRQPPKTSAA
ncbi:MAG: hypothetical protein VW450_00495 [Chloroflexota bacterium]